MNLSIDTLQRIIDREKAKCGVAAESVEETPQPEMDKPQRTGNCDFIHLHNHTDYSALDGMCRIPDLVARAVELGMPAVAMTDHGNMGGAIQLYRSCMDAGVKPIIGCEVYQVRDMRERTDERWHLVLLAKDEIGYRNLVKITSAGYLDGFHRKPRIDLDYVSQHSDGLIAMTACLAGHIPSLILTGRMDEARVELGRLQDIFGDDLYVEIMDHGMDEQGAVNPELVRLAGDMEVPVVATNDCHYINADDAIAHEVLLCLQTKKRLADEDRFRFPSHQFWFRTAGEMAALFPQDYLQRTMEVAEKCDLELDLSTSHYPQFPMPDGSTAEEYLWKRIQEGIRQRYGDTLDTIRQDRLRHEYDVICRTGFAGYFLIIEDMIRFARGQGIRVGAGRGSAVASLVCYALGITSVDPMEHGLLFQRFLTEDRVSPPDIDVDFDATRRGEIIEYLRDRYGHTAGIITFNRLSPKSLIRDVGRVLDMDKSIIDAASARIPNHTDMTLAEMSEALGNIDQRVIDIGTRLNGVIRHSGCHPGGVVISERPLTDFIPLCISGGTILTQFDKDDLESCGMLKLDALGNEFLSVVDMSSRLIRERYGIDDIPIDDTATYRLISSGDVIGIFQLGARWGRKLAPRMQPRSFRDIVHIISIGRPGVLDSGLAEDYFTARGSGEVHYLHPNLEPILSDTYGIILFQEQIMQIAVEIAGFTWSEADRLRKAIGKKDDALMADMQSRFVGGCHDIPRAIADELWDQIAFFGGYGFNKAHAAGYADLTYRTAYLKAHYPLEYLAGLLSVKGGDPDDRRQFIAEARRRGIDVRPPDINMATDHCTIVDDAIMLPLTAVSGIAEKAYEAIMEAREAGSFSSYEDFCERVAGRSVNRRIRANLIMAGAFDSLQDRRALLRDQLEIEDPDILALEHEVLGIYISGHPLDCYDYDVVRPIGEVAGLPIGSEFRTVGVIEALKPHVDRNGGDMAFITIEDWLNCMEIVILASVYRDDLEVGMAIHAVVEIGERGPKVNDYEILELAAAV